MRARFRSVRSVLAGVTVASLGTLGLAVPLLLTAAPAAAATTHYQVITVQSVSAASTTARVDLWQLASTGAYAHVAGPIGAYVGELGIGQAHEGTARTPAGVFGLTQAFGNQPSYGTKLPYFQAGPADWWDEESGTRAYNTHVHQAAAPGPTSENLYYAGSVYSHAVVIDYNRFPVVAGAGSGFFLHVTNNQPTAGCVAISSYAERMVQLWLDPAKRPVISIGVNAQATRIITDQNAAAATHNPRGHLDTATAGAGKLQVTGWAADFDSASSRLSLNAYVDGTFRGRFATGVPRPDVVAAVHAGPDQGFSFTVGGIAPGRRTICVYAVNILLGTTNPSLGCLTRTVS